MAVTNIPRLGAAPLYKWEIRLLLIDGSTEEVVLESDRGGAEWWMENVCRKGLWVTRGKYRVFYPPTSIRYTDIVEKECT